MLYKTLSVVAPAGKWIAEGSKTIEVRSWESGLACDEDLLIVENKTFLREDGAFDDDGRAVALVKVTATRAFTERDIERARATRFAEGYYSWELSDIRPVRCRKAVRAERGIYVVNVELEPDSRTTTP